VTKRSKNIGGVRRGWAVPCAREDCARLLNPSETTRNRWQNQILIPRRRRK